MGPNGDHDVTKIQTRDHATFVFVFECKGLPCMFQLQFLEKLSEFHIVQVLLAIVPKVQSDEFAVPVKRDVMMDNSLSKNLLDIFLKGKRKTHQSH